MTGELVCVGVSHHQTPVDLRERVCFRKEQVSEALCALKQTPNIDESFILSTCNRVELYAHSTNDQAINALEAFLSDFHHIPFLSLKPHLYRFKGQEVAQQFFRVASSLDSLVLGEAQILGQVKDAINVAREVKALGPHLNLMFNHALMTAKRIRTETHIARHSVSISHIAVELIESVFSNVSGRKTLIVGAGTMAEVAARCLAQKGASLYFANRTKENAHALASVLGGISFDMGMLENLLVECDIILTSTNAVGHLISHAQVQAAMRRRRYKPLFFVDIAVPRNIDPAVAKIDGAYLYNIDDLSEIANNRLLLRAENGVLANNILDEELQRFETKRQERVIAPLIADLNVKSHRLADDEMARFFGASGPRFSSEDQEDIRQMTHAIVNKLLHQPIVEMKTQISNWKKS
jgi:glutamyl-tRNA reductase